MEIGPEYLCEMAEALKSFTHNAGMFVREYGSLPVEGSQADSEKNTFVRPQSIVTAWAVGNTLIEFGGDHVSLFVKTITPPVENIGCWTCVRSMLESCSIAAWLLDPAVDARTRVGRVFAYRYEGLDQQLKFGRSIGIPANQIKAEEDRISAIEVEVVNLGYPKVTNKKHERVGLCQRMPSATDMIDEVLNEGTMYRMLSGVAHGHHWAVSGLCFKQISGDIDLGNVVVKQFEKTDDIRGIALLGACAMKSLSRPLWNMSHYFGWDSLKLEEIFENVSDCLRMNEDRRFWRS